MTTLAAALLDLAIRIAKAIVRRLARWTVRRVVVWMRERVRVFKARWKRARIEGQELRMRWLEGRIERWTKAADWIEARALDAIREEAAKLCRTREFRKLPEYASCERWRAQG